MKNKKNRNRRAAWLAWISMTCAGTVVAATHAAEFNHDREDGGYVGTFVPGPRVNGTGSLDKPYALTALTRQTGECLVPVEDDWRGKNRLYGWMPDAKASRRARTMMEEEERFLPLFSDEALAQWRQCGPGRFVVTNGIATGEGGMGLWWYAARQFTNFVLRGEFVQEQDIADSGVFLRFPNPGNDPWVAVHKGHEMEIGDPFPQDPTWRTGSIYPFAASSRANTKPPGQWNTFEVTCAGQEYTVRINDEVVTRWTDPRERASHGFIGLQNYNDNKVVRHRNLRIKTVP